MKSSKSMRKEVDRLGYMDDLDTFSAPNSSFSLPSPSSSNENHQPPNVGNSSRIFPATSSSSRRTRIRATLQRSKTRVVGHVCYPWLRRLFFHLSSYFPNLHSSEHNRRHRRMGKSAPTTSSNPPNLRHGSVHQDRLYRDILRTSMDPCVVRSIPVGDQGTSSVGPLGVTSKDGKQSVSGGRKASLRSKRRKLQRQRLTDLSQDFDQLFADRSKRGVVDDIDNRKGFVAGSFGRYESRFPIEVDIDLENDQYYNQTRTSFNDTTAQQSGGGGRHRQGSSNDQLIASNRTDDPTIVKSKRQVGESGKEAINDQLIQTRRLKARRNSSSNSPDQLLLTGDLESSQGRLDQLTDPTNLPSRSSNANVEQWLASTAKLNMAHASRKRGNLSNLSSGDAADRSWLQQHNNCDDDVQHLQQHSFDSARIQAKLVQCQDQRPRHGNPLSRSPRKAGRAAAPMHHNSSGTDSSPRYDTVFTTFNDSWDLDQPIDQWKVQQQIPGDHYSNFRRHSHNPSSETEPRQWPCSPTATGMNEMNLFPPDWVGRERASSFQHPDRPYPTSDQPRAFVYKTTNPTALLQQMRSIMAMKPSQSFSTPQRFSQPPPLLHAYNSATIERRYSSDRDELEHYGDRRQLQCYTLQRRGMMDHQYQHRRPIAGPRPSPSTQSQQFLADCPVKSTAKPASERTSRYDLSSSTNPNLPLPISTLMERRYSHHLKPLDAWTNRQAYSMEWVNPGHYSPRPVTRSNQMVAGGSGSSADRRRCQWFSHANQHRHPHVYYTRSVNQSSGSFQGQAGPVYYSGPEHSLTSSSSLTADSYPIRRSQMAGSTSLLPASSPGWRVANFRDKSWSSSRHVRRSNVGHPMSTGTPISGQTSLSLERQDGSLDQPSDSTGSFLQLPLIGGGPGPGDLSRRGSNLSQRSTMLCEVIEHRNDDVMLSDNEQPDSVFDQPPDGDEQNGVVNTNKLIPPNLVFSPASRRASLLEEIESNDDVERTVPEPSLIKAMLGHAMSERRVADSASRCISRSFDNSLYQCDVGDGDNAFWEDGPSLKRKLRQTTSASPPGGAVHRVASSSPSRHRPSIAGVDYLFRSSHSSEGGVVVDPRLLQPSLKPVSDSSDDNDDVVADANNNNEVADGDVDKATTMLHRLAVNDLAENLHPRDVQLSSSSQVRRRSFIQSRHLRQSIQQRGSQDGG